jgi:hypothetical protein
LTVQVNQSQAQIGVMKAFGELLRVQSAESAMRVWRRMPARFAPARQRYIPKQYTRYFRQ